MISELDSIDKIRDLIIRGTFEGTVVRLGQLASVKDDFEENTTIVKFNGHEGVRLNVVKKSESSILDSNIEVVNEMGKIKASMSDSDIEFILMDDESESVRDRLSLISMNGLIGFILILYNAFYIFKFFKWLMGCCRYSFQFLLYTAFSLLCRLYNQQHDSSRNYYCYGYDC